MTSESVYAWNVTDYTAIVASNIRAEVARAGMNAADVSRALGVSRATVSFKWTAKRPWSLPEIEAIAGLLGIEPWELTRAPHEGIEIAPIRRTGANVRQQGLEPRTRWLRDTHVIDLAAYRLARSRRAS